MAGTPAERVNGFLVAMRKWEVDFGAKAKHMVEMADAKWARTEKSALKTLTAIYDEYLTERAKRPDRFGSRFDALQGSAGI